MIAQALAPSVRHGHRAVSVQGRVKCHDWCELLEALWIFQQVGSIRPRLKKLIAAVRGG